jgi:hypothetical protein
MVLRKPGVVALPTSARFEGDLSPSTHRLHGRAGKHAMFPKTSQCLALATERRYDSSNGILFRSVAVRVLFVLDYNPHIILITPPHTSRN